MNVSARVLRMKNSLSNDEYQLIYYCTLHYTFQKINYHSQLCRRQIDGKKVDYLVQIYKQ